MGSGAGGGGGGDLTTRPENTGGDSHGPLCRPFTRAVGPDPTHAPGKRCWRGTLGNGCYHAVAFDAKRSGIQDLGPRLTVRPGLHGQGPESVWWRRFGVKGGRSWWASMEGGVSLISGDWRIPLEASGALLLVEHGARTSSPKARAASVTFMDQKNPEGFEPCTEWG